MSDDTTTEAPAAAESTGDGTETPAPETVDYKDRFEAMQKVNRDLERKFKEAASFKDRASELEAEVAKYQGKESEYAAAQEAQRVKDEALAVANERILKAEVRAAAAGKLNDPADALRFLDLSALEVGADGEVDSSAVAAAIQDLVTEKPYLAAQGGKRFQGSADGGARNDASKPAQLSEADVKRLYAEKRYDEIESARLDGRLDHILGFPSS